MNPPSPKDSAPSRPRFAASSIALFALSIFGAAAITFTAQPLVGRQLLPMVGGGPSVWTACLAFFQIALLGGYGLAHALSILRRPQAQLAAFALILGAAATALPFDAPPDIGGSTPSAISILWALFAHLILPFTALAMASPMLQRWFAAAHPGISPYPLYAASNLGSLGALLAYPLLVEPELTVEVQQSALGWAFIAFAAGSLSCGVLAVRARSQYPRAAHPLTNAPSPTGQRALPSSAPHPWLWIALAAAPSSLLASTTEHLTSNIAPVPLLWTLPLALYLLTFVVAFSRQHTSPGLVMISQLGALALGLVCG